MPVILERKLLDRLVSKPSFLHNDICICAIDVYKQNSSVARIQLNSGYRGLISGVGVMPCAFGDMFSYLKSTSAGDEVLVGQQSRVLSVDVPGNAFDIGIDLGATSVILAMPATFCFSSPANLGLFGMFGHAAVDMYVGDVPTADDDLDLLTSACQLSDADWYPTAFDQTNYSAYARFVYDGETGLMSLSGLLAGVATQDGPVSWIRISSYCRERTAVDTVGMVRYSMIVPVADNPGVYLEGDLVTGQPASINVLQISL